MKRARALAIGLLAVAGTGCPGCKKSAGTHASTGGSSVAAPVVAPAIDAGPPAPYQRVVKKVPPLPRQANLAQIFIGYDRGAAPWLPAKARKRSLAEAKGIAERIATEARRGADFDALAKKDSEWPLSDRNGATFGVQTEGGQSMLAELDAQIFALKVGEVSAPLESPLGYHVVKRLPQVHVAHILVSMRGSPLRTHDEAKALAEKIAQDLKTGVEFGDEAFTQSDDLTSAGRSGDLGVLDPRTAAVSKIYQTADRLKVGEVSSVIEIPGGFEIVKRLE